MCDVVHTNMMSCTGFHAKRLQLSSMFVTLREGLVPMASNTEIIEESNAERRQITVMFCDIVGSSALAARLDPEDFSDLIIRYRRTVTAAVEGHGGFVARYVGDGVLAYWGYPRAHEDDPNRCIASAIDIVAAYPAQTESDSAFSVRIGVETGIVVVGDFATRATQGADIVGDAPNMAAQLQSEGGPGDILVTATVRGLTENHFEFEALGARKFKARGSPVEIYRVCGRSAVWRRPGLGDGRMFGRENEEAALEEAWRAAAAGDGGTIIIAGDAGIGKSMLVSHLRRTVVAGGATWLEASCSEEGLASALVPIRELVMRGVSIDPLDAADVRDRKLAEGLAALGIDRSRANSLSALLGIGGPPVARDRSTFEARQTGFSVFRDWLEAIAAHGPLAVAIDNVHWADAVTQKVLRSSMDQIIGRSICMVLVTRGQGNDAWLDGPKIGTLRIGRLRDTPMEQIINLQDPSHVLSPGMRRLILAKSEGIPLFAEELVKLALGAGASSADVPALLARPSSLNDSLIARLDALGPLKPIAQAASVIGDYFDERLLADVLSLALSELRPKLEAMSAAGFVETHHDRLRDSHSFRHGLLREVALHSLLKARRRELHARTGRVLAAAFPQKSEARPDLVAQHFTEAGLGVEAATWWRLAGDRATRQFAPHEAITSYQRALSVLGASSDSDKKMVEADIRMRLAMQLVYLHGHAAPEVGEQLLSAARLAEGIEDPRKQHLFRALWFLHAYRTVRGEIEEVLLLGERLLIIANATGDVQQKIQAYRLFGFGALMSGDIPAAATNYRQALDLYEREHFDSHKFLYASDPGVVSNVQFAWTEWLAGRIGNSHRAAGTALRLGREIGHPHSLAQALCMLGSVLHAESRPEEALKSAVEAHQIATANNFPYWAARSEFVIGWAEAVMGSPATAITRVTKALENYASTGAREGQPYGLAIVGSCHMIAGEPERAIHYFKNADALAERLGLAVYRPEIIRLSAESHLALGKREEASSCLNIAYELAERQGSRSLMLRIARDQFESRTFEGAADRLRGILASFSDEPDTFDSLKAKKILPNAARPKERWLD